MNINSTITPEVLSIAPGIIRPYFTAFLFMGINILSTYHLQSTIRGKLANAIALLRSITISGALLFILPLVLDILGVWLAIPIAELIVVMIALRFVQKST